MKSRALPFSRDRGPRQAQLAGVIGREGGAVLPLSHPNRWKYPHPFTLSRRPLRLNFNYTLNPDQVIWQLLQRQSSGSFTKPRFTGL